MKALASLSRTDQEILLLTAWEELPQADVASVLDISIGAVRQRLYQAKKNLAVAYDRQDHSEIPTAKKGGAR
jgi:RNA polymerase sigma-70 factor (ECF subfamily)